MNEDMKKIYVCLHCGEEVYPLLESCHIFCGIDDKFYLVHTEECLKKFRPDVYEIFEARDVFR